MAILENELKFYNSLQVLYYFPRATKINHHQQKFILSQFCRREVAMKVLAGPHSLEALG
jgi:hypothetical protein